MPVVPRVTGSDVQEQAAPDARLVSGATVENFGGGGAIDPFAEGVNSVAQTGYKVAVDAKAKADQTVVTDAAYQTELLKNAAAIQTNTFKGKDAGKALEVALPKFDEDTTAIEAGLADSTQRDAYREKRLAARTALQEHIQTHIATEAMNYQNDLTSSYVALMHNDATDNYSNPIQVQKALDQSNILISQNSDRLGQPPAEKSLAIMKNTSDVHSKIVTRYLDAGDSGGAKAYLDAHRDQIMGDQEAILDKGVRAASKLDQAQKQADQIIADNPVFSDQLEAARQIEDPEVRQATRTQLLQTREDQETAKNYLQKTLYQKSYNDLVKSGGDLTIINPVTLQNMSPEQQNALATDAKRMKSGEPITTNWATFSKLRTMAADRPEDFAKIDPLVYRGELADTEFKQIVDAHAASLKNDTRGVDKLKADEQMFKKNLVAAGVNPNPKPGTDDAKFSLELAREANAAFLLHEQETGKPPGFDDRQKIYDTLLLNRVDTPGMIFGTNQVPAFQLGQDQPYTATYEGIAPSVRASIETTLKQNRKAPSKDNVLKYYQLWLNQVKK